MAWHAGVLQQLEDSGLFSEVKLSGGKVRATVSTRQFLDIHYDPTTQSYSYALIDLSLPYPGDKRILGWDDYPHPGQPELAKLETHPHHYQERLPDGTRAIQPSAFRGNVAQEIGIVVEHLSAYLARHNP